MAPLVSGVDGCRGGWLVASAETGGRRQLEIEITIASRFAEVIALDRAVVAADVPIGLLETYRPGGRRCDAEARALLGRPRSTSVFSPPARRALNATTFEDAKALCRMSRQSFGILPKVAEVDRAMDPSVQHRVVEVHPELTFAALNEPETSLATGVRAMAWSKKTVAGHDERFRILADQLGLHRVPTRPAGASADDLLDALAALVTALRIVERRAIRIPAEPPIDERGLRMEIWI